MKFLCFDIASGGVSAAIFNSNLQTENLADIPWSLEADEHGGATVSVQSIVDGFKRAINQLNIGAAGPIDAVCIGAFLHNFVLIDDAFNPVSSVFTWLDRRGEAGIERVRAALGDRFHEITGCRYHPMYPVFKLAAMQPARGSRRIASVKTLLLHRLTGAWLEDQGTASASGLCNLHDGNWDSSLLGVLQVSPNALPPIARRMTIAGRISAQAATEFGLPENVPVLVGTGDGFLANIGSECESPPRIAVTLGTSGVARQTLHREVVESSSGTFCYRADDDAFLLGCAGNNGGNVLDWGNRIFPDARVEEASDDPPIFIPLLHGERSPDWDPHLTGSWHGLKSSHTAADLKRSILEGVVFNLAHYIDIIQRTSGEPAKELVLSGNGFRFPAAASTLAAIVDVPVLMPGHPGLASLRGAAICCLRAFGLLVPELRLTGIVPPNRADKVRERYRSYRRLR